MSDAAEPKSKIEWALEGLQQIQRARFALINASADLGTPPAIKTACELLNAAEIFLEDWFNTATRGDQPQ